MTIHQDFARKRGVMTLLNEMLDIDINRKSTFGIRLCSLNFVDPASLLSWMQMRRMVIDVGKRFSVRLEGDILAFIVANVIEFILIILKIYDVLDLAPLILEYHYYLMAYHLFLTGIWAFRILWAAAYINEETDSAIEKFVALRHLSQCLSQDKRILSENFRPVSAEIRKAAGFINLQA